MKTKLEQAILKEIDRLKRRKPEDWEKRIKRYLRQIEKIEYPHDAEIRYFGADLDHYDCPRPLIPAEMWCLLHPEDTRG